MKAVKLLMLSVLASGFASSAFGACALSPTQTFYVNGSTAWRAETYFSICKALQPGFCQTVADPAANVITWVGQWLNDGSPLANQIVEIRCSFNGSAEGVSSVCTQDTTVPFKTIAGADITH